MERSNHKRDIINGFQLGDAAAKLLGYALDMQRLGAVIDDRFWDAHLVEIDSPDSAMDFMHVSGPIIRHKHFDLFESLETNRKNAAIILEALQSGFELICGELENVFLAEDLEDEDTNPLNLDVLSAHACRYLNRPAEEKDLLEWDSYRRQSAILCDVEPVLYTMRTHAGNQHLWNGEWRALIYSDWARRNQHYRNWRFNHVFTSHRLRLMLTRHLYATYPESFGDRNA